MKTSSIQIQFPVRQLNRSKVANTCNGKPAARRNFNFALK